VALTACPRLKIDPVPEYIMDVRFVIPMACAAASSVAEAF